MLITLLIIAFVVFIAVAAYLYFNQDSMVFIPFKELAVNPGDFNIGYEDVFIEASNKDRLHGWYIPTESDSGKVVLFCHGNAGNIANRMATIEFLRGRNVNILLFDYRGFGRSAGKPSEEKVYEDARLYYDWLITEKKFLPEKIIIFGRSLGGAVAIDLAINRQCGGLIVESSFTNMVNMGKKIIPFLPVKRLLRYNFNNLEKISRVVCPKLITHSSDDEIIPFEMGKELYENAQEPKKFIELKGGHNERIYLNDPKYIEAMEWLLQK